MDFDGLIAEGLAASREGRRDAALAWFRQAGTADPDSGLPPFLIASEQASAGDFAAAEAAFAHAVLLAPAFALARYQLGLLQFSGARMAVALLTWQPLLALPDGHAFPHFVRGFGALAAEAPAEAIRHFREGLARRPENPALCADVQQLITSLEALDASTPSASGDAAAHVLLSAYAGRAH